jgi:hypothetical protein
VKRWLFALAGLLPPNFVVVVLSILTSAAIPAKTNTEAKTLTKQTKQTTLPEKVTPQTIIDRIKANPKGAVGYEMTYVGKQYSIADLLRDLEKL